MLGVFSEPTRVSIILEKLDGERSHWCTECKYAKGSDIHEESDDMEVREVFRQTHFVE